LHFDTDGGRVSKPGIFLEKFGKKLGLLFMTILKASTSLVPGGLGITRAEVFKESAGCLLGFLANMTGETR
jgi:hypothetical protein